MSDLSKGPDCVPLAELYGEQLTVIEGSLDGMFKNASVSADGLPCNGQICGTCTRHQLPGGGELLDLLGVMKEFPDRPIDDQTVRSMVTETAQLEEYRQLLSRLNLSPNDLRLLAGDQSFTKAVAERIRFLRSKENAEQSHDVETVDMWPLFILADVMSSEHYAAHLPTGNSLLLLTAVVTDKGYVKRRIDEVFTDDDMREALKDLYFGDHGAKVSKADRTSFAKDRHPTLTKVNIVNNYPKMLARQLVAGAPKTLSDLTQLVEAGGVSINLQAFAAVVDRMPAHYFDRLFAGIDRWYTGDLVKSQLKFRNNMLERLYCIRDFGDLQRNNHPQTQALSRLFNVLDYILKAHEEAQQTSAP